METLKFDLSLDGNQFKRLNATNGGPWRSTRADYKAARIPYSRNHDAALYALYGAPYIHDVSRIFPNFDADPNDPASYDFPCTDKSILTTLEAGTETFFRLGESIEHQIKKHATLPPKDFHKWAVICEHIIRHYNEGWADGFHLNIQYWEIWNEPDLDPEDATNKRTWGGTKAQFFDFYEIAAKHLKGRFPHLKIGGPAWCNNFEWGEDFLSTMHERNVPIDFFSWHVYAEDPHHMTNRSLKIRKWLDTYGYSETESILDEWNFSWLGGFTTNLKAIIGIKGATFTMACICAGQQLPIDMMMYYDTMPSLWNGVFDYYTCEKLKGYYPLYWYGMFYDMEKEIKAENQIENIYSLCGVDKDGKVLSVITHYSRDDDVANKTVTVDFGKKGVYEVYLLDSEHDGELIKTTDKLEFDMPIHSAVLIKEI